VNKGDVKFTVAMAMAGIAIGSYVGLASRQHADATQWQATATQCKQEVTDYEKMLRQCLQSYKDEQYESEQKLNKCEGDLFTCWDELMLCKERKP
jgi:hypothetical protein